MNEVQFLSDMQVKLIKSSANDALVVAAARVSTRGEFSLEDVNIDPKSCKGLINCLMRDRHGSPFEHSFMTFYIHAPIFVFREFMRHRIASYNEESGRYKKLKPLFYIPDQERKIIQTGKPGHYLFEKGNKSQVEVIVKNTQESNLASYKSYLKILDAGVSREIARIVLPLNIYSSMYVTLNSRSLMNFLSLRTISLHSHFPSFPQREIEMVAEKIEQEFSKLMPITYNAFNKNGRVAP